jgi:hypothetical protein
MDLHEILMDDAAIRIHAERLLATGKSFITETGCDDTVCTLEWQLVPAKKRELLHRDEAKRLVGNDQALDHIQSTGKPANLMNGAKLSFMSLGDFTAFLLEGTDEEVETAFDHLGGR